MLSKKRLVSTGWEPKTKTKSIHFIASSYRNVLELLSRDSEKSLQEPADGAFADLLAKHRPRTFVEALKQVSRPLPANENKRRRS
jgi:hypothetical protein